MTQGQKSDNILLLMANTFKALCEVADWSSVSVQKKETKVEKDENQMSPDATLANVPVNDKKMNLHYNIQIHLPETTNMAVYDSIFQSLKKHLL